jgi:hypothetical protein
LGSEITKDGGMVGRIIELETEVAQLKIEDRKLKDELAEFKMERKKTAFYVNIIYSVGGGLSVWIVKLLFEWFKQ